MERWLNFGTSVRGKQKTWTICDGVRCLSATGWDLVSERKMAPYDGGMCHNSTAVPRAEVLELLYIVTY